MQGCIICNITNYLICNKPEQICHHLTSAHPSLLLYVNSKVPFYWMINRCNTTSIRTNTLASREMADIEDISALCIKQYIDAAQLQVHEEIKREIQ